MKMDSNYEDDLFSGKLFMDSKKKDKSRKTSLFFGSGGGLLTDRFSPDTSSDFTFRRKDNIFTDANVSLSKPSTSIIDAIPSIPDLDEMENTLTNETSADAPVVAVNKLSSYQDLEKDILKLSAFSSLQAAEFTPLLKKILSESETNEEPGPWTWDSLIASVASKLNEGSAE